MVATRCGGLRRGPAADGDRKISKKHLRLQFQDLSGVPPSFPEG
jgi:hypothetical protein